MLQLKGICKSYYTDELETRALLDINMTVERGEYISIEGPSGCGKSTLLSILGLLDSPSSGSYTLNGRSMVGLSINERAAVRNRAIGFIFQNFNLIGDLDVCSNVELPLDLPRRDAPRAQTPRRGGPRTRRAGAPGRRTSRRALGRSATTGRRRAGARGISVRPLSRRADG